MHYSVQQQNTNQILTLTHCSLYSSYATECTSSAYSAVKGPRHFEVRKSSSQVTRMHFFPQEKLTTFFSCRPQKSKHRPFHRQNKPNKAVRYGNIYIFCSHYYRSKATRRARQGGARAWATGGGSSSQVIWPAAPWCSGANEQPSYYPVL